MTQSTPEIIRIAQGLTKAQRRYLTGEAREIGNPAVTFLCGIDAGSNKTLPTRTALYRRGVMECGRFGNTMLTPLGLQVATYLKEQSNG